MKLRRHVSRRGLLIASGAGLAGAALAACGPAGAGGSMGGEPNASQRTQPITIRFMSWRPNAMDRFEKKWNEWAQPRKITLQIDRLPNSTERNTALTTQLAADQAPDATDSHSDVDFKNCEAGHFMVLDKYLTRDKITQEKGYGLTYAERWRGKTYQLSYWVEPFGIYYNKTLFKKHGIPDPWEKRDKPGEWTFEEMLDIARRATNPAADEWGLDWSYGYHDIGPLIWSQGSTHYNYDPMTWTLDNAASVQAHSWMQDWVFKSRWNVAGAERSRMMQPWGGRALDNNGMTPFAYGKVAIHYRSVNDWSRMWPVINNQFDWDMLPIPTFPGGKVGASWTAGHPVNMWSKSKHPDDVWEFLKFLIGDDFQRFMSEEQVLVPAKIDHQARFFRPPSQYPYQHAKVFSDVFKKPHGIVFRHFKASENGTVYNEYRDKIYRGELGVTNGLKEAQERMNREIDWGGGENPFKGLKLPIVPK